MLGSPENLKQARLKEARKRVLAAGAQPPVRYIASGLTAYVFCDGQGLAWKIAKSSLFLYPLEDEAEWLAIASADPDMAGLVPRFVDWKPDGILVRECINGTVIGPERSSIRVWRRIGEVMKKHGWTAPESSESNFICPDRECLSPVMVDLGYAHRIGPNLEKWISDVIAAGDKRRIEYAAIEVLHSKLDHDIDPVRASALQEKLEAAGAPTEDQISRGAY